MLRSHINWFKAVCGIVYTGLKSSLAGVDNNLSAKDIKTALTSLLNSTNSPTPLSTSKPPAHSTSSSTMGDQLNGNANPTVKRLLKGSGNLYRIEITNAEYTNRTITDINAAAGTGNSPVFGVTDIEDDTQVVRNYKFL